MQNDFSPTERLLKLRAVLAATAQGRASLYGRIARGDFPKPVKVGRLSAWPESEVLAWIEARKTERNAA